MKYYNSVLPWLERCEKIFGFKSLSENGTAVISNSPVGTITKISKQPVVSDESHRLTEKVTGFFTDPTFQITPELLDDTLETTDFSFRGIVVSVNYSEGITSGSSGSTVDMYVTSTVGSLTGGDVLSLSGYTASFLSNVDSEFLPYTGQVLYIENVRPVQRNADQDEEVKLVIEF